jgi:trigger factor
MNLTQEKIDNLNAIIKVKLSPEDYQEKVESSIKSFQKKASMPGFRPGKVPVGMIKKLYGKSILADEINKLLNDSVNNYIRENALEIIGQPIPSANDSKEINWESDAEFEFAFDLGLAPEFVIDFSAIPEQSYQKVKVDEEMVNKEIADMRNRYAKVINAEVSTIEESLLLKLENVEEEGKTKVGLKTLHVSPAKVENEAQKNALLGLTKGQSIVINPFVIWPDDIERAREFSITAEQARNLPESLPAEILNISKREPAEINEELFSKIYGDQVNNEEEFRAKIKSELETMFNNEAERKFLNKTLAFLTEYCNIQLPESFLKRWLMTASDKPVTPESIENDFSNFAKQLKSQLLVNKLLKQFEIRVAEEEVDEHIKKIISQQFLQYNGYDIEEDELSETIKRIKSNQKEYERVVDRLYDEKISNLLSQNVKKSVHETSIEEFYQS